MCTLCTYYDFSSDFCQPEGMIEIINLVILLSLEGIFVHSYKNKKKITNYRKQSRLPFKIFETITILLSPFDKDKDLRSADMC